MGVPHEFRQDHPERMKSYEKFYGLTDSVNMIFMKWRKLDILNRARKDLLAHKLIHLTCKIRLQELEFKEERNCMGIWSEGCSETEKECEVVCHASWL